ncbi:MAG: hypothetical protein FGM14_12500 [Flavobacteriales bacterium]|nr:hypothetical protein [Flavobacteriales bacterium]
MKTNSMENGLRLKDNVGDWIKTQILPYIENYIAGIENKLGDKIIQFDQLKISLNLQSGRFYSEQLPSNILLEINQQLKPLLEASERGNFSSDHKLEGISINSTEREIDSFFYFLLHGKAPWYNSNEQLSELLNEQNLQKLISEKKIKFYSVFFDLLEKPIVQLRMIRQFSEQFLLLLIQEAFAFVEGKTSKGTNQKDLNVIVKGFNQVEKERFWQALFLLFLKYQTQKAVSSEAIAEIFKPITSFWVTNKNQSSMSLPNELQNWLEELTQITLDFSEIGFIDEDSKVLQENESASQEQKEEGDMDLKKGIIVENAGLILTHPFLKHFFNKVELIDDNNSIKDPFLAVHILHYIATGKTQDWDHNLLFEKFLCNVPMITSIPRHITIPENILTEIDELLKAMLQNWTILSNSSPDLLRVEFLQRPGKLMLDEYNVNLTIERKTQDILLDKLPWNISIVKLPWHKNLLYTTW